MDARSSTESSGRADSLCGVVLGALVLAGMVAGPAAARAAEDGGREARRAAEEARLQKIRAEIDDLRQRLERTEARTGSVLDAIEEIDLRVSLLRREAESLRQEKRLLEERQTESRWQAGEIGRRLSKAEEDLRRFLAEAYKVGPVRALRLVAASSTPAQFASARRAAEALSLEEGRRIEEWRADRQRLVEALADLERQAAAITALEAQIAARERDLGDNRHRKEAVLAGLQREHASQKKAILELGAMEGEIRRLLGSLSRPGEGGPLGSLGFARFRGLLRWPVEGRLAVPFGNVQHPRFSTVVPHPGLDIAAPPGREVRSVFEGRVVFSDWFKGYGEMVVIDHGDGYLSVYGHVSERLVLGGQAVRQGEVIARAGEGGAFDTAGVYFEIRHDGRPEDPARWLHGRFEHPRGRSAAGRRAERGARPAPQRDEGTAE